MEVFVSDYEWNAHFESPQQAADDYLKYGDRKEGEEFELVRLNVIGKTTYRIVDGKAVPIAIATPDRIA